MNEALARTLAADAALHAAHASLVRSAAPLRASLRRRPATWLVAGGFVGGLLAGLLPTYRTLQTGLHFASLGMRLLMPFLAGIEAEATQVPGDANSNLL